ncbi:MAG: DUF882 domain-containing protein [Bosea sp. (in: a-proteobacteria)]
MASSPDPKYTGRPWKGCRRLLTLLVAGAAGISVGSRGTQDAVANGDTRSITIQHMHTKEVTTVTFRRDGRYVGEALAKLNHALRDWRNDNVIKMDPRLFDIAWEVHREVGSGSAFHVVSAYRSPGTNAMLRRRSRGVAKHSQHMEGKAMDFYLSDASSSQVRAVGMKLQRGGVGFYPTANTPFIHLDVGSVRSWPRMPRDQLARLFPGGNTVHIAADGRPLEGYEAAKAQILARGGSVGGFGSTDFDEGAIMQGSRKSLWASLFGWNEEEEVAPARGRGPRGRSSQQQVLAYAPATGGNTEHSDMYAIFQPQVPRVPLTAQPEQTGRRGLGRGRTQEATQIAALPAGDDTAASVRAAAATEAARPATASTTAAATAPVAAPALTPVPNTPRFVAAPFPVARPNNLIPVQMASVDPGSTGQRLNWQQGPAGAANTPATEAAAVPVPETASGKLVLVPLPPRRPDVGPAVQMALASAPAAAGAISSVSASAVAVPRDLPGKLVPVSHPVPPERPRSGTVPVMTAAIAPLRPSAAPVAVSATASVAATGAAVPAQQDRQALTSLFAAVATGGAPTSNAKVTNTRARAAQMQAGQVENDSAPAASLGFSQRDPNDTRADRFSGPAVRSLPTTFISR